MIINIYKSHDHILIWNNIDSINNILILLIFCYNINEILDDFLGKREQQKCQLLNLYKYLVHL